MTKRWVKLAMASLGSAAAVAACSSSDEDGLFDPIGGRGGSGGAADASGGVAAGGGSAGMSSGATGASSGGALGGGGGGTSARGGAGGGGAAGKTSGGSAGSATGGASTGGKASGGAGAGGTTSGGSAAGGKAAAGADGGESDGGDAGSGGDGGTSGDCSSCGANAECVAGANGSSCVCLSGFVGNGITCARPISCAELHQAEPALPSGAYTLRPAGAASEFDSYCEMVAEGGGFTLVVNAGPAFDPSVTGNAKALGYQANGTNLAYSQVLLASDVMLDVSNSAISAATYSLRIVISGVHAQTRGHTVRALFSGGPYYLENENNSNLVVRTNGAGNCGQVLELDFAAMVCDSCNGNSTNCSSPVIVFGDVDRCNDETPPFAIGGAVSYVTGWGNCAGWPQSPTILGNRYFPDNFRVWIR